MAGDARRSLWLQREAWGGWCSGRREAGGSTRGFKGGDGNAWDQRCEGQPRAGAGRPCFPEPRRAHGGACSGGGTPPTRSASDLASSPLQGPRTAPQPPTPAQPTARRVPGSAATATARPAPASSGATCGGAPTPPRQSSGGGMRGVVCRFGRICRPSCTGAATGGRGKLQGRRRRSRRRRRQQAAHIVSKGSTAQLLPCLPEERQAAGGQQGRDVVAAAPCRHPVSCCGRSGVLRSATGNMRRAHATGNMRRAHSGETLLGRRRGCRPPLPLR